MADMLPSQVVDGVTYMFGPSTQELDEGRIKFVHRAQVQALLALMDQTPSNLPTLRLGDLVEYDVTRAALSAALHQWNSMGQGAASQPDRLN